MIRNYSALLSRYSDEQVLAIKIAAKEEFGWVNPHPEKVRLEIVSRGQ
jgi:hypothetical protein